MLNYSDIQRKRLGKSQLIDFDPEIRFMSLSCTEDFHIFTGCSDGYIRHFYFDRIKMEIQLIDFRFYGKCILHVHYMHYDDEKYLLTMATDGHICFWRIQGNTFNDTEPFHRLQHHSSGINSFDLLFVHNRFLIATGGDDQSTVISYFHLKNQSVEGIETIRLNYHTAQVNGMKFASDGSCLYTISLDQIVFRIELQTFTPHKHGVSTIADAKGLHLIPNNKILIYGCWLWHPII